MSVCTKLICILCFIYRQSSYNIHAPFIGKHVMIQRRIKLAHSFKSYLFLKSHSYSNLDLILIMLVYYFRLHTTLFGSASSYFRLHTTLSASIPKGNIITFRCLCVNYAFLVLEWMHMDERSKTCSFVGFIWNQCNVHYGLFFSKKHLLHQQKLLHP